MDLDSTMFFRAENSRENATREILNTVYEALQEKGYDPINQLAGYIISGSQLSEQITGETLYENYGTGCRQ